MTTSPPWPRGRARGPVAARRAADRRQGAAGQGLAVAAGQSLRLHAGPRRPEHPPPPTPGSGRRRGLARGGGGPHAARPDQMAERHPHRRRQARRNPARAAGRRGDRSASASISPIIRRISTARPPASARRGHARKPCFAGSPTASKPGWSAGGTEGLAPVRAAWLAAAHPIGTRLTSGGAEGAVRRPRRDRGAPPPLGRRRDPRRPCRRRLPDLRAPTVNAQLRERSGRIALEHQRGV